MSTNGWPVRRTSAACVGFGSGWARDSRLLREPAGSQHQGTRDRQRHDQEDDHSGRPGSPRTAGGIRYHGPDSTRRPTGGQRVRYHANYTSLAAMSDIFEFLGANGIAHTRTDHPAVFTVEESKRLVPALPATQTKNLFLRDQKGIRHFLVVVGHDKHVDLKALAPVVRATKLSLGSPERLLTHLGIEPGSVSLLALVNDRNRRVEVFIDRELWQAEALACHPLVNTATLVIAHEGIVRFLQATGHEAHIITVPSQ